MQVGNQSCRSEHTWTQPGCCSCLSPRSPDYMYNSDKAVTHSQVRCVHAQPDLQRSHSNLPDSALVDLGQGAQVGQTKARAGSQQEVQPVKDVWGLCWADSTHSTARRYLCCPLCLRLRSIPVQCVGPEGSCGQSHIDPQRGPDITGSVGATRRDRQGHHAESLSLVPAAAISCERSSSIHQQHKLLLTAHKQLASCLAQLCQH